MKKSVIISCIVGISIIILAGGHLHSQAQDTAEEITEIEIPDKFKNKNPFGKSNNSTSNDFLPQINSDLVVDVSWNNYSPLEIYFSYEATELHDNYIFSSKDDGELCDTESFDYCEFKNVWVKLKTSDNQDTEITKQADSNGYVSFTFLEVVSTAGKTKENIKFEYDGMLEYSHQTEKQQIIFDFKQDDTKNIIKYDKKYLCQDGVVTKKMQEWKRYYFVMDTSNNATNSACDGYDKDAE